MEVPDRDFRPTEREWMASTLASDPLRGIVEVLHTAARMFDEARWRMISRANIQFWGETLVNRRIRDGFLDDFHTYRQLLAESIGQENGQLK